MDFQLVLVERDQPEINKIRSSSGLLIDNKFVLLTCNVFVDETLDLIKEAFQQLLETSGKLCLEPFGSRKFSLNVISQDDQGLYAVQQGYVLCSFLSDSIRNSNRFIFKDWAIDAIDNNRDIQNILSLFVVLTLYPKYGVEDFKISFQRWWSVIGHIEVCKCDPIYINSVPFASRNFMNTYSRGVVSNVLGLNSCLILSDCSTAGGSEGAPVFNDRDPFSCKYPIGIVISSLSWWRGEWIGYTLIVDIKTIIVEIIDLPVRLLNANKELIHHRVVASSEFSLVQVYCMRNWGTAILINADQGIFITNSHVVDSQNVKLYYKGKVFKGELIYKTPVTSALDIAVLKSKDVIKDHLKPVKFSFKKCNIGDPVYSAGFSLFPKESEPSPTVSKGCISQYNRYMLRTTCAVHPGASGGAIFDKEGCLIGIIVCNTKLHESKAVFPRINMAIPILTIQKDILGYLKTGDSTVLGNLHTANNEAAIAWSQLENKL